MLKRLETTNFKKLESIELDLSDGSNIVIGPNGIGKTTLFEAIRFALYGASSVTGNKKFLPTWGQKDCSVRLWIKDFIIERTLKNCTITNAVGEVLAEGHSACTAYVETELTMDAKGFSVFSMSQQGETQALLTLGVTELNRRVEQYAGVQIIDAVVKAASADKNALNNLLDGQNLIDVAPLIQSCDDKQQQLNDLNDQTSVFKATQESLSAKQEKLKQQLAKRSEHNSKIIAAKEAEKSLKEKQADLRSELKEVACELAKSKPKAVCDINTEKETLRRCRQQTAHYKNLLEEQSHAIYAKSLLVKKKHDLDGLVSQEVAAQAELPDVKKQLKKFSKDAELHKEKLTRALTKLQELEELVSIDICPTCQRSYDADEKEALLTRIEQLEDSISLHSNQLSQSEAHAKPLREKIKSLEKNINGYLSERDTCEKQLEKIESNLSSFPPNLQQSHDISVETLEQLVSKLSVIEQNKEHYEQLQSRSMSLEKKLTSVEKSLQEVAPLTQKNIFELSEDLDGLREAEAYLESLTYRIIKHQTKISEVAFEIRNLKDDIASAKKFNKVYRERTQNLDRLNMLIEMLRTKRQSFMSSVWNGILVASSNFVNSATDGWITELGRDDSGNFTFSERGGAHVPVIGGASGAQKAFLGVGVRVGLGQALLGRNMALLLDEPTEAMSEENAGHLADALLALGGQTLFITHRNKEAVSAQRVIKL